MSIQATESNNPGHSIGWRRISRSSLGPDKELPFDLSKARKLTNFNTLTKDEIAFCETRLPRDFVSCLANLPENAIFSDETLFQNPWLTNPVHTYVARSQTRTLRALSRTLTVLCEHTEDDQYIVSVVYG